MGKASSAKKVARAARAGGRVSAGQPRSLLFPGVLALVIVLGLTLVVWAREDRRQDDLGGVPQIGDHIHQAFAMNICDEEFLVVPEFESPPGLHTHGDGVLHIHPFSDLAAGANATLGRFFRDAKEEGGLDLELTDEKITFLGDTYEEGEKECEGVEDPILRMAYWSDVQDEASTPEITTGDFTDLRLTEDGAGITIFYGDPDAEIPKPPTAAQLSELGAADGGQVPDEAGVTSTTDPEGSTSTTASTEPTSTTQAEPEPTTTAAP
ncbi:MAG: hypothetical protein ACOYXM_08425 [Actinomycetota bacterium]